MSLVTTEKFNELVNSTTTYLQSALDRIKALEEKVEKLEKPAPRARKENTNDQ